MEMSFWTSVWILIANEINERSYLELNHYFPSYFRYINWLRFVRTFFDSALIVSHNMIQSHVKYPNDE